MTGNVGTIKKILKEAGFQLAEYTDKHQLTVTKPGVSVQRLNGRVYISLHVDYTEEQVVEALNKVNFEGEYQIIK